MSQPTEVIVYRNPLEYALWNAFDLHIFFIVIVAVAVGVIAAVIADNITQRFRANRFVRKHQSDIILLSGGIGAILTCWYMWI